MKIQHHIILYSLLAAGILLFSLPVLRPACKRMQHQVGVAAGKHQAPAGDMETPASCGAAGIAIEPVATEYALQPVALIIKKSYPAAKTRFPPDPFPECIDAPPRVESAAM
ncbi:hypothetical protein LL912_20965 [Niabella sp. CC-SYL272]|uniref:hypothetical protein n=1 Tax=Niabella agricola TaxID=2891571 RepID=UPI001F4745BD|nr:hypothetical protein [Niabella agricola]MCF3111271.1 hypothetical protein [Niabella agricola]